MARALDPIIADTLTKYGFGKEAVWDCHGVWVVYHRVLEKIALKAGIWLDTPTIVEADSANGIAVVCVKGTLDKLQAWSIGEASPKNNKNAYCWAMAEKRAIDRVVLKLIGLHGLAYSEEEADDFKSGGTPPANGNKPASTPAPPPKTDRDKVVEEARAYAQQMKEALELAPDVHTVETIWREEAPALAELKTKSEKAHAHLVAVAHKRGFKEAA